MKKEICFFIHNISNSGGTERVVSMIANQLSRYNYSVLIVSLFSKQNKSFFDLDDDIKIRTIFNKREKGIYKYPFYLFRLKKILDDFNVDVIVNVDSILVFYTIPVCYFSNKKIRNICWEHFNYYISLGKRIRTISRKLACKYCDDVITLTEKDKLFWTEENSNIKNIVSINNPAQANHAEHVANKVNSKILISVGRLTHQKGFDLLIEAFNLVVKHRKDWVLYIVGDGEEHHALSLLIKKLELSECIKLIPATKNIDEIYRNSSMYIMSSRFEGLPMVLLEATTFGLPIVSFDCDTGPSEVIRKEFGWLCKSNDVNALSETILHAFDQCDEPVTYNKMRKHAYLSSFRFSIDKVTKKWIDLLEA